MHYFRQNLIVKHQLIQEAFTLLIFGYRTKYTNVGVIHLANN
jgi:hypothetical protein